MRYRALQPLRFRYFWIRSRPALPFSRKENAFLAFPRRERRPFLDRRLEPGGGGGRDGGGGMGGYFALNQPCGEGRGLPEPRPLPAPASRQCAPPPPPPPPLPRASQSLRRRSRRAPSARAACFGSGRGGEAERLGRSRPPPALSRLPSVRQAAEGKSGGPTASGIK